MGLAVSVGILADLLQNDPEGATDVRADLEAINRLLAASGLPRHTEPESLPRLDDRTAVGSFPYSCLHQLRRVYAWHVATGQLPPPLTLDARASHDSVLELVGSPQHHLLWHSDCEGYYVPIDFPYVIEGEEIVGGGFGSSQRLMVELCLIAPPLGITLENGQLSDSETQRLSDLIDDCTDPYETEIVVWLALFEAARLSIHHRTAIHFG